MTQANIQNLHQSDELNEAQAAEVFERARAAARDLRKTTVAERVGELKKVLHRFYEMREEIMDRVCEENGKCRTDALVADIMGPLDFMEWLISDAEKILADEKAPTPLALMGKKSKIYHEPLGACLLITPWNYPVNNSMIFTMTGFIAGNAIVFKPSEHTPLKGLLEKIFDASPLIKNSVQVVYGSGTTAQHLIDQRPAKIFFTGSNRTGHKIMEQASKYLIPLELELGGKDPAIVFDDVDLKRTVAGVLWGAMTNTGQSCTSIEKLYIQYGIYEDFIAQLKAECEALVVNNADRGDADVGAMTARFQTDIVQRHLDDAVDKGAKVLCGGDLIDGKDGKFFLPTVLTDIPDDAALNHEETFGPLLPVYRFNTEDEVIDKANDTEFGLSASVWSKDLERADRVARALEVGAVSINNVMLTEGNPHLPFGGRKSSGFGRVHGPEGLLGWTASKAIIVDKQSDKLEANWYPFTIKKYTLLQKLISAAVIHNPILKILRIALAGLPLESHAQKPRD
ncbi:succinate-semialdehyde dehydrogenase [gamma proteobacterium HTCC5015]|nr:succinate-semialdehyde dehydrogenase [gamma proteobacterium HTCC5015]